MKSTLSPKSFEHLSPSRRMNHMYLLLKKYFFFLNNNKKNVPTSSYVCFTKINPNEKRDNNTSEIRRKSRQECRHWFLVRLFFFRTICIFFFVLSQKSVMGGSRTWGKRIKGDMIFEFIRRLQEVKTTGEDRAWKEGWKLTAIPWIQKTKNWKIYPWTGDMVVAEEIKKKSAREKLHPPLPKKGDFRKKN
jgi:hypothetical protein